MERSELRGVLKKIEVLERRTFTPEQSEAWFEILGEHSAGDASEAVLTFHSKPFKRPAYPGDIKAHILEIEALRLRRCGTVEVNVADLDASTLRLVYPRLRALVATGQWTRADYLEYQRSGLPIEEFNAARGAVGVG